MDSAYRLSSADYKLLQEPCKPIPCKILDCLRMYLIPFQKKPQSIDNHLLDQDFIAYESEVNQPYLKYSRKK